MKLSFVACLLLLGNLAHATSDAKEISLEEGKAIFSSEGAHWNQQGFIGSGSGLALEANNTFRLSYTEVSAHSVDKQIQMSAYIANHANKTCRAISLESAGDFKEIWTENSDAEILVDIDYEIAFNFVSLGKAESKLYAQFNCNVKVKGSLR